MLRPSPCTEWLELMARTNEQLAMLFPGQGSQTADMREAVERHRPDLLELARAEVSDDLFERAAEGTRWAQPAIFCAALAGYEVLKRRYQADLMAGHSLGEITALVAAEAIDAADGLRLVAARGRLMQEARGRRDDRRAGTGARAGRAGRRGRPASRSPTTTPPTSSCCRARSRRSTGREELLRERKVRAKRLPVGGAFHSPLMEPAVAPFRDVRRARSRCASRACRSSRA